MKKKFWLCAWSTFPEEFKDNLQKLGEVSEKAAEDLLKYPPHTWCRAYFSSRYKSYMVDNNISESFNATIINARHKPIVSMLEEIRLYCINKIKDNMKASEKWYNEWSLSSMEMYQYNRDNASGCLIVFNRDVGYEIGEGADKHTVFLDKQLYTCRVMSVKNTCF